MAMYCPRCGSRQEPGQETLQGILALAQFHADAGGTHWPVAVDLAGAALRLSSGHPGALEILARGLAVQNRLGAACRAYEKLRRVAPGRVDLWGAGGFCYGMGSLRRVWWLRDAVRMGGRDDVLVGYACARAGLSWWRRAILWLEESMGGCRGGGRRRDGRGSVAVC